MHQYNYCKFGSRGQPEKTRFYLAGPPITFHIFFTLAVLLNINDGAQWNKRMTKQCTNIFESVMTMTFSDQNNSKTVTAYNRELQSCFPTLMKYNFSSLSFGQLISVLFHQAHTNTIHFCTPYAGPWPHMQDHALIYYIWNSNLLITEFISLDPCSCTISAFVSFNSAAILLSYLGMSVLFRLHE